MKLTGPRTNLYPYMTGTALTQLQGINSPGVPRRPKAFVGNTVHLVLWLNVPIITFGSHAQWDTVYPSDTFTYSGAKWLILLDWRKGPTTSSVPTSNLKINRISVTNCLHPNYDVVTNPNATSANEVASTFRTFFGDLSAPVGPTHQILHQMSNSNRECIPSAANPLILTGGSSLATERNVLALRMDNTTLGGADTTAGKITLDIEAMEL